MTKLTETQKQNKARIEAPSPIGQSEDAMDDILAMVPEMSDQQLLGLYNAVESELQKRKVFN